MFGEDMQSDQLHVPAFIIFLIMACGQAINRTIELFDLVYICRNLHYEFILLV